MMLSSAANILFTLVITPIYLSIYIVRAKKHLKLSLQTYANQ